MLLSRGVQGWARTPGNHFSAGVAQRLGHQPSKLRTWVRLPSPAPYLGVVELVDMQDLGSCAIRRRGSTPLTQTRVTSDPLSW